MKTVMSACVRIPFPFVHKGNLTDVRPDTLEFLR
jgi:hypothetical protein